MVGMAKCLPRSLLSMRCSMILPGLPDACLGGKDGHLEAQPFHEAACPRGIRAQSIQPHGGNDPIRPSLLLIHLLGSALAVRESRTIRTANACASTRHQFMVIMAILNIQILARMATRLRTLL